MPHQRQVIRERVKAILVAAATAAGSRVFETRTLAWKQVELPAISVYTLDETTEDSGSAPRELTRKLTLEIVAAARASNNVDDDLDNLALQIERAMHADWTLGNTCGDSVLLATEMAVEATGDKPIGMIRLNYGVIYRTYAPEADDVTLDDLKTVDAKYNLGAAQVAADAAEDKLNNLDQ